MATKKTATTKTKTEVISRETILRQIEGECEVVPSPYYSAKQAYNVLGLGKLFDGVYYCRRCVHRIDSNGYAVSLSLAKVGEGTKVINEVTTTTKAPAVRKPTSKKSSSKKVTTTNNSKTSYKVGISGVSGKYVRMGKTIK